MRFLEVEPDEEVMVPRRPEYSDAVVTVSDSLGEDIGEVF